MRSHSATDARRRRPAPLLGAILFALACDGSRTPTQPAVPNLDATLPLALATANFDLRYSAPSAELMAGYGTTLEANRQRILSDLGVAAVPRIEGLFHPDPASFTAATGYVASGSVDGPLRFHVVAIPYAPEIPVHELAHNVTLHLAPEAGNNPVWLWEAVAVYEAGQFVDPASLPTLVAGDFPTLAELDQRGARPSIYDVGYLLAEFIVERFGLEGLRRLIQAEGDVAATFGMSVAEFERQWRAFVVARYL
jgi:hypothetical protein